MFHRGNASHKFGEALRKTKAAAKSDPGLRGEKKSVTGMEAMPRKPEPGSAGNRAGKPSHPSGTLKADKHKIKGKVRRVSAEAVHGGHKVSIEYHGKKGGFGGHEEHFHPTAGAARKHFNAAMDNMEPEQSDPDSMGMAQSI